MKNKKKTEVGKQAPRNPRVGDEWTPFAGVTYIWNGSQWRPKGRSVLNDSDIDLTRD